MIALRLERQEATACQAFTRASEQAELKIIAAVQAVRPFREKLRQAKLERAAFAAGQVGPDREAVLLSANASLSALGRALNVQTFAALDKPGTGAALVRQSYKTATD